MKQTLLLLLGVSALLCGQEARMLDIGESVSNWPHKVNVGVVLSEDGKTVAATVKTGEFSFGWIQHLLPPVEDYTQYAGIYGRYRSKNFGALGALILLPDENGLQYYTQKIGQLGDSEGQWVDFYLPFADFVPSRGARHPILNNRLLATTSKLEIGITGLAEEVATVEFDSLCMLRNDEVKARQEELAQKVLMRSLKPENPSMDAHHPRLLLHGDFLKKIQAKATAGGDAQTCYESLIRYADNYLKTFNADDPFGKIMSFEAKEGLTPHQKRGSFEGALTPAVQPIEILAAAGLLTGDERYSRWAAKGLVNMARTLTVKSPQIELGFYYTRTFYVRALAFGYDWLYHFLTPEERHEVKATLLGFVQDIYNKSWNHNWGQHPLNRVWNWNPGLVGCAGLGMLAMEGETKVSEVAMLVEFRRHLRDYLTLGIDFDGCCHEGPSYIAYGIGAGVEFAECLRQQGRGDLFLDTNWHLIAPWIVSEMLPNRQAWNNLSDCNHGICAGRAVYAYTCGRLAELARLEPMKAGERYPAVADQFTGMDYIQHFSERPGDRKLSYGAMAGLMGWAWQRGCVATTIRDLSPTSALSYTLFYGDCQPLANPGDVLPEGMLFHGRGLAVSRVGYDNQGIYLAVEAGPHAAGHDQGDKSSFTYSGYGQEFFIDSGYGNDGDNFKSGSSYGHNMVLVDGQGQPINWHNNSNGEITGYHSSAEFDWIRVDALQAWNINFGVWIEQKTSRNMAVAERQFFHVRGNGEDIPPYLVVYDKIRKNDGGKHAFTWQWHIPNALEVDLRNPDCWKARPNTFMAKVLTTTLDYRKGKAVFEFKIPREGDYKLFGLTAAGGADPGKSDSFIVVVNGERINAWDTHGSRSLTWVPVMERGERIPCKYSMKAGDTLKVELIYREPETQLARFMLLPYEAKVPMAPDEVPEGALVLKAEEAVLGETPLLLQDFKPLYLSSACLAVYPVATPEGRNQIEWYETSQNGTHRRLLHTVENVEEPGFIMVVVPQRDAQATLPDLVRKDGEHGVRIKWKEHTDIIHFEPLPNFKRGDVTWSARK